ncbi:MAG TPA: hypothetical protein PKE55_08795 [Kiritimatiellia bacterium]|nr:hypothetical protein [Kiritimatiellia bacterium]
MKTSFVYVQVCLVVCLVMFPFGVARGLDVGLPMTGEGAASTLQSLEAMQRALQSKEVELGELQGALAGALDDGEREDYQKKIRELRAELEERRRQFDGFAADIDLRPFVQDEERPFDWQEQLGRLLQPIMAELESATAETRQIGQLRTQLEEVRKRRDLARRAVENLERLTSEEVSPELQGRLTNRLAMWTRTFEQADHEYTALDIQLQTRLAARESVLDQSTNYIRHFFRTRGMNLLLGVSAFLVVFFGFRLADVVVRKAKRRKGAKSFGSRLTTLLFHIFSVLGGILAMMLVFNLMGDWFLLGIIIILLIAVVWAGVHTLPQQVETIKLMLNIGAVREGERLIFDGTAYRVASLGFSARLENPLLDGGIRQMPVKYLVGMTSRPCGAKEEWFPTGEGDWVELSDGVTGRVISQTPSAVQLELLGGARAIYPTNDFMGLGPKNLSKNFRVETRFGVDYRHQAESTGAIPAALRAVVEKGVGELVGEDMVRGVQVDLCEAGASALEYLVTVDVAGEAAGRARDVRLAIPGLLVGVCNEQGWTIPFTQVVVHQGTR